MSEIMELSPHPRLKLFIFIGLILTLPIGGVMFLRAGSSEYLRVDFQVPAIRNATFGWNGNGNLVVCSPPTTFELDCDSATGIGKIDPLLVWPVRDDVRLMAEAAGDFRHNGLRMEPGGDIAVTAGGLLIMSATGEHLIKIRDKRAYIFPIANTGKVVRREFSFTPQPSLVSVSGQGEVIVADSGWDSFEMVVSNDLFKNWKDESGPTGSFQLPFSELKSGSDGWSMVLRVRGHGVTMNSQGTRIVYCTRKAEDSGWKILVRDLKTWDLVETINADEAGQGRLALGIDGEIVIWPGQTGTSFLERMAGLGMVHYIFREGNENRIVPIGRVPLCSWGGISPMGGTLILVHPSSGRISFHDLGKIRKAFGNS
ncbi:MAG: hypothetical protein CVV64_11155 [Candidatus Wallbacteria bacterium HGW-Wallbacteria-1]|jgi:hypothetical protein|uniref:Uncharacterized protein n=1 Tax=Candidatus Wallbacteria bacterium HGW-Wallbacteria-1 TaxID=2013854 RepID=A0A2N1PP16_9BACT|nr:MAG: hypothetical protein CVV64_11155 [Candidatus Wallbacteria bacterium HGW-Wallbacteria-1]